MRRTLYYFTLASLELARYFVLVNAVGYFATSSPSATQALRIIAAPNSLFAIALLFLGLNAKRYEVYKPLFVVGKLAALFSGLIILPRLLGNQASSNRFATYSILGIAVWDVVSVILMTLPEKAREDEPQPSSPEPERVELD